MKYLSLLILSAIVFISAGCGKGQEEKIAEKAIEKQLGEGTKADISDDSVSIESKDKKTRITAGKNATVPEDFPKDIYIYPDSRVEGTVKTPTGKMVTLVSQDDVAKIFETYQKEMKSLGWEEQTTMNMNGQAVLTLKKDERAANITIAGVEQAGGNRIMLLHMKKQ